MTFTPSTKILKACLWTMLCASLPYCSSKNSSGETTAVTTSISNITSSTADGTYNAGQTISIQVVFSTIVTVTGIPQLNLETGCADTTLNYSSGSGTDTLSFIYTVQAGDQSSDLDYLSTSSLTLNGGAIVDGLEKPVSLILPTPGATHSLATNKTLTISTTPLNTASNLISGTPSSEGHQDQLYSFEPTLLTNGISFTGANLPSWSTINSTTGKLSGEPSSSETHSNIYICATKDGNTQTIGPFSIVVTGDPLKSHAWHLKNTGQSAFSQSGGTSGADLNLSSTLSEGITGDGIKIAISDSGTQIAHEDLTDRIIPNASRNYTLSSPWIGDPTPSDLSVSSIAHGTAVAGIVGATGWNNKGSRGVAPEASLAAFLLIGSDQTSAILADQANGDFDIFNYSYGYDSCQYTPINASLKLQLETGTTTLRNGKGVLYIKAGGNEFIDNLGNCNSQLSGIAYYGNSNWDGINSRYEVIVVGAIRATGIATTYSSPGSNIWVSAPGGQFGTTTPAIISTDILGCTNGFSRTSNSANTFESGGNSLNTQCDYTSTMNGTSSATPNTSGAVALMLDANSNLTWRDVKYILAKTAERVEPTDSNSSHPGGLDLTGHTYQQGWVQNAAGIYFNNQYGFGAVDIDAAVALAKTYTSNLGVLSKPEFSTGAISLDIPDANSTGVTSTINVTDNLKIEAVEITFSVIHSFSGDLGIELTSPSNTKSILVNINSNLLEGDLSDAHLISNAFLDEMALGNWSLKIIDGATSDTGRLTQWKITINGHTVSLTHKKGDLPWKSPLLSLFDSLKDYFIAS